MESYKILQKLGKGAQGCVFLVEDKETGQKLVLKKVECNDEAQANKAFKEAVALQQLNHPYICGYKEFFVVWDQKDYAIYVCIVMDYYQMGDMEKVLKGKREQNTPLEELVLKKWIGQLVEALHHVHSRGMIHRDLKPSNVFLKDDMSITIGDFGVATVMGNIRTVTRTTVGSMNWIAPEVLDIKSKYDERSDIWSLGCVIVEMATCGFMDAVQVSGILYQFKEDPQVLEKVLEQISSQYSLQLCQLIRMCLIRAFKQRPTSSDLVDLPYIQECLGLCSSSLYKGASNGGDTDVKLLPEESGVKEVVDYLRDGCKSEKSVKLGLTALLKLTAKQDQNFSDDTKQGVLTVMRGFPLSCQVQTLSCQVLHNISTIVEEGDSIFSEAFVKAVLQSLRSHSETLDLLKSALSLVTTFSTDERAASCLGQEGGIQDVLAILRAFSDQPSIVCSCCTALWSLSVIEANLEILTQEKGVVDVCKVLHRYEEQSDLVEAALSTLWSLSMDDANLDVLLDYGMVDVLLKTIATFVENPGIVKFAAATLSSLAQVHEVSAYRVVHSEGGVQGIPLLLQALETHRKNADVTETLASLFHDLSEYREIREELNSLGVSVKLSEVKSKCYPNQGDEAATALAGALAALCTGPAGRPSSAAVKRAKSHSK